MGAQDVHSLRYMPQLDGVRAVALLAVLNFHFFPHDIWPSVGVHWGSLGVRLFFVLSGFLITTILLRDFSDPHSPLASYGNFVLRRAFRLYPILLVTLLVSAAFDLYHVRQTLPYTLTYTFNFHAAITGDWHGPVAHLWTLAVEEQFYLLWPLVLFVWLRKGLPLVPLLIGFILTSLIFRCGMRLYEFGSVQRETIPLASVDALSLGALVAVLTPKHKAIPIIGGLGCLLWLASTTMPYIFSRYWYEFNQLAFVMIFAWVVARAADGFSGASGAVLNNAALRYIGTISYGAYVLHLFVPYYLAMLGLNDLPLFSSKILAISITFALAALSWHFLERPIMRTFRPARLVTRTA
jgi:peptidoglycan/LPS O-acetylase OafA/YrhL